MAPPPMLHCHRSQDIPTSPDQTAEAAQTAESVLEAFQIQHQRVEQPDDLYWHIPACPRRNSHNDPAEKTVNDVLRFPNRTGNGYSVFVQCCADHAVINSIAAAEIAQRWREAGLIDGYCDRFRWGRHLFNDQWKGRIQQALRALGVPYSDDGADQVLNPGDDTINPDPEALTVASTLFQRLAPTRAAVALFGSRATGSHGTESDIDLLVFPHRPQEDKTFANWQRIQQATTRFLAQEAPGLTNAEVDANIVEQGDRVMYAHHSQNLQQTRPNALVLRDPSTPTEHAGIEERTYRPDLQAHPAHLLNSELWVEKVFSDGETSFGRFDKLDMPRCKRC